MLAGIQVLGDFNHITVAMHYNRNVSLIKDWTSNCSTVTSGRIVAED